MKRSYYKLKCWVNDFSNKFGVDIDVHKENDYIVFSNKDQSKNYEVGLSVLAAYAWFSGYTIATKNIVEQLEEIVKCN